MIILTLAVSLPSLRPPDCKSDSNICEKASELQIGVFYFALYVLAVANGGTQPNIVALGGDQFDEFDPKEKLQKASFFNWWLFGVFIGTLIGQTLLIYIQQNVGFSLGYGIPTAGLIISVVIFFIGTPFYRHKVQKGNPFSRMAQVIVAAARKWRIDVPSDYSKLHEVDPKEYVARGRFPIHHTPSLRWAKKEIIPELIGRIEPKDVAVKVVELLQSPSTLKNMRAALLRASNEQKQRLKLNETELHDGPAIAIARFVDDLVNI